MRSIGEARTLCVKGRSSPLQVDRAVASGSCVEGSSSGSFVEGRFSHGLASSSFFASSDLHLLSFKCELPRQFQFYRPDKQPMAKPVSHEVEEVAEDDDDPLAILMKNLHKLNKGPVELYWELRVFGLQYHMPLYLALNDALEVVGGERMLNILVIQLWCIPRGQQIEVVYPKCNEQIDSWACEYYIMSWMKTIIREGIKEDWTEWFNSSSSLIDATIRNIRQE
ncbi:hypothetical protein LR48_Vigan08g018400 [Vigna angularis]|uniref:Uncharacterized protein n=1 Tax=Phaseolus angularis TaxID=3914 RepID=A0A0L9V352_PHAAN|nr:hypothetical protein LR48_Vigan08g018400 [Vigna angularis]